jgi:hypothetical protein
MDLQTTDHRSHSASGGGPLSRPSVERLLKALDATAPAGATDSQADRDENRRATRELFESLDPRDPAEAQLAAIAIAAAQSAMDNFARAAQPGVADEAAIRLRSSALTAGRTYAAALRTFRKRAPQPAATRRPAAAPRPAPVADPPRPAAALPQGRDEFQPRDRFGKPIPTFRTEQMTRTQMLATLTWPRDPTLEAAATAEEEAMITEQAALAPGKRATPDAADPGAETHEGGASAG